MSVRTRVWPRLLGFALLASMASGALAGDIEGQVQLPRRGSAKLQRLAERYPGAASASVDEPQAPAIVFLEGVPAASAAAPPAAHAVVTQRDRQFRPLALPVLVGTTVDFLNEDDEYHNVFSRSRTKELELGRYGRNESRSVVFDKPGLVRLRCEIHSTMHAVVLVLENPYFATTDDEGRFRIAGVPAGTYRVYAFHEEYRGGDKGDPQHALGLEVRVPAQGSVRADFDLRSGGRGRPGGGD